MKFLILSGMFFICPYFQSRDALVHLPLLSFFSFFRDFLEQKISDCKSRMTYRTNFLSVRAPERLTAANASFLNCEQEAQVADVWSLSL